MPTTATIVISPIGTQRAGVPFAVTGTYTLSDPTWTDTLTYQDGNDGAPVSLPPVTTSLGVSSISFQHPGLTVGTHTVSITDPYTGTVVTSNSFSVIGAVEVIPTAPTGLTPGVTFTFTGALNNYLTIPTLAYSIDGGPPQALGGVTLTGWSSPVVAPLTTGQHTISVTDGTPAGTGSVSFSVAAVPTVITPVTPTGTVVGQNFTFQGAISGYLTAPSLTYRFDTSTVGIPITGITPRGWSMVLLAPGPAGSHTITVSDGTQIVPVSFVVAATPQAIIVNAPAGAVAGQTFTFTGILQGYTAYPSLTYSIDGGAAVTMTGVTNVGWSMNIAAPSAGVHTISVTDGTIVSKTVSFTVTPQSTVTRIWYQNPGEDGTYWVAPFETTAAWINSGALITTLRNGTHSSPTGFLHLPGSEAYSWYVGGPTDPVMTVTDGSYSVTVHVPAGAVPASPDDQTIGIADTTKPYMLVGIGGAVITNAAGTVVSSVPSAGGGKITGRLMDVSDGSGQFMMDAVTGQPGTGNGYASISEYDLQQALASPTYVPQHMVQFFLDPAQVNSTGPIWPLKVIDNSFSNTGNLPQGLTVGIPANAIYPTGKVGNRAFKFWWDLFQQFGGFFYNVAGTGCFTLDAYPLSSPTSSFCTLLSAEMNDLVAQLCILNPGDAPNYVSSTTPGAQYSVATQKGRIAGQLSSPAFPPPPPLDLSPTNGMNVAPNTFGAWYPSGYNRTPQNSTTSPTPTPTPTPAPTAIVTWDPTHASSNITLSNNNRTATSGGSSTPGSTPQSVLATYPLPTSGIVVWDVVVVAPTRDWAAGVADASFNLTTTNLGADGHGMGFYPSTGAGGQPPQTMYFAGNQLTAGNGITSPAGDIVSFVLNGTLLFSSDSAMRQTAGVNFNNSTIANPITGAGGFAVSGTGIPLYPAWNDGESGGSATILDGSVQAPLSPFLQGFLAANPTARSLSSVVTTPGVRAITPNQPSGVVATTPFAFSGALANYLTMPTLSYTINGGAAIVIPSVDVTVSGWNVTVTIPTPGATTIVVSDGSGVTGSTTFTAASPGSAPPAGVTITGVALSNTSGVASSPVGTVVGNLTATASGGTLVGVTFQVTPTTSFKIVGAQLQFASGSVAAATYALSIKVSATNATNSPQSYPVTVTVGSAGAKTPAALLAYLNSIAGTYTISAQFIERGPLTPIQNIFNTTGYWLGGICGDYWYDSSTILTADTSVNPIAKSYWANGGLFFLIPSIPNPTTRGAAVDTSSVNGAQLTVSGTPTNTNLNASLDSVIAGLLDLQSAGVIVIFRPFPEMNGTWFWWGAGLLTAAQYVALWQYTWNRVTAAGVTNVLWLWAPNAGFQSTAQDRYPGAAYVDIVGQDLYTDDPAGVGLAGYQFLSQYGKVQALSEFGPGGGQGGDTSFDETTLIAALNSTLQKVVFWVQWWDQNSNGPGWGMASVQNVQAALASPRVLNRGEIAFFNQVTAPNPLITMPMGDLMTIGTGSPQPPGAYRAPLLTNMATAGYTLQFCGDQTQNPGSLTGLNQRHEGLSPITATTMQAHLVANSTLSIYQPNVVILLLGYYSLYNSPAITPAAAYSQLTALCQYIIQQLPNVKIIVSNEPGITADRGNTGATPFGVYNALIAGIGDVASNISFADINTGWQSSYIGSDGVSPNTAGCAYMAQVYQSAIVAVYGA